MPQFYLRIALLILGFGVVLGLLYFASGLNRGLGPRRAAQPAAPRKQTAERVASVRGLVLVMSVALIGGIALARPVLLLLGVVALVLAYSQARR